MFSSVKLHENFEFDLRFKKLFFKFKQIIDFHQKFKEKNKTCLQTKQNVVECIIVQ